MTAVPLIQLENARVQFGSVVALEGINFHIGGNEVVGLLGDNGAGKSTLIKALLGIYPLQTGHMFFAGREVVNMTPMKARDLGIETVHQEMAMISKLSVARNFFLGREPVRRWGPLRLLNGRRMIRQTVAAINNAGFAIERPPGHPMEMLSGGSRQVVAITRAFFFARRLLVLDEPTAALSEHEIDTVLSLVEAAKARGLAVIFITHKAHEVFKVADRFVVLNHGREMLRIDKTETHLKELEKLLITSRLSAVREMAAGVAHQVRNPLGVIKVTTEMLRDDFQVAQRQEQYKELLQTLFSEVESLELIVSNFLNFALTRSPELAEIAVTRLISGTIEGLPLHKYEPVDIRVIHADPSACCRVDPTLTRQVLANIIINALEASPAGGRIEIRTEVNERLHVSIRDSGPGIEPAVQRRMFYPFFSTKTSGSGLGLAIVHKILDALDGRVEIESAPGRGTVMHVEI